MAPILAPIFIRDGSGIIDETNEFNIASPTYEDLSSQDFALDLDKSLQEFLSQRKKQIQESNLQYVTEKGPIFKSTLHTLAVPSQQETDFITARHAVVDASGRYNILEVALSTEEAVPDYDNGKLEKVILRGEDELHLVKELRNKGVPFNLQYQPIKLQKKSGKIAYLENVLRDTITTSLPDADGYYNIGFAVRKRQFDLLTKIMRERLYKDPAFADKSFRFVQIGGDKMKNGRVVEKGEIDDLHSLSEKIGFYLSDKLEKYSLAKTMFLDEIEKRSQSIKQTRAYVNEKASYIADKCRPAKRGLGKIVYKPIRSIKNTSWFKKTKKTGKDLVDHGITSSIYDTKRFFSNLAQKTRRAATYATEGIKNYVIDFADRKNVVYSNRIAMDTHFEKVRQANFVY